MLLHCVKSIIKNYISAEKKHVKNECDINEMYIKGLYIRRYKLFKVVLEIL